MPRLDLKALCENISDMHRAKRKAFITFHSVGDRDAVGAAIALAEYIGNASVSTPDFITNNTMHLLKALGINKRIGNAFDGSADVAIVVDANNAEVLGGFKEDIEKFPREVIFIDHHFLHEKPKKGNYFVFNDENYNSASSIVYAALKMMNADIGRDSAEILLNGIVADSAELQNAKPNTFIQIGELLGLAGIDYQEVMESLRESISPEIRKRVIKDICNGSIENEGGYLIIYGVTGSHANIAADTAIKMGADASVFWTENNGEVSISARLRPQLDKQLSIHLGRVMATAGMMINGNGGGHPCAAGAYGPGKRKRREAMDYIISELKGKMS